MDITGLGSLFDFGGKILDKLFPDPAQAAEAKLKLFELQQSGELAQMAGQTSVNQEEAKSTSIFIAGWRPFIGWVCGSACAWNWIGISLVKTICTILSYNIILQPASLTEMLPILLGMLGLGAYRTYEKSAGVEGNR